MTVTEMFTRMMAAFPAFTPAAMESLGPSFRGVLQRHEGPVLERAFTDLLANWLPKPSQRFPMPKDFENFLPSGKLNLGAERKEQPLNWDGRADRAGSLAREWRERQGHKASRGVHEVLLALAFTAEPLCWQEAWKQNPGRVILTHDQLRIARQRAVSQERMKLHGAVPKDPETWWAQVEEIQHRWGIQIPREDWTARERETPAVMAEARPDRPLFVPAADAAMERMRALGAAFRRQQDEERRSKTEAA